ncbi:alpha-galactosidase/alpha-n-acetylgalactosaminidase-like protein [Sarcoptes scabiei]|uniref:Alpha-galactosidase n=1 Tax=Sarcoptes scabiei TaxID=52283 RepID=A0A132AGZ1_SARSC|nr:alpha-galactosidase/alpha-n-acetylgalactosaminidase-like protein [Sarcoptes scabiei]
MTNLIRIGLILIILIVSVFAWDNGLLRTPPMGWISWLRFTCQLDCDQYPNECINEKLYKDMVDRMAQDGYLEAGYNTVNIDDCWMEKERDPETKRLVADRQRFPNGIKHLVEYGRAKNVSIGIYQDIGTKTCAGFPGTYSGNEDHSEIDSKTFAEWGVDSIKMDGCFAKLNEFNKKFTKYRKALEKQVDHPQSDSKMILMNISILLIIVEMVIPISAWDNGLLRTPPMGWLSWLRFTCEINCEQYPNSCINEKLYKDMIDRIAEDGYLQVGYKTVNIDDCWMEKKRDPKTKQLVADRKRFPYGIKHLVEYGRERNVSVGIYEDIAYIANNSVPDDVYEVIKENCNYWRNYDDIVDSWESVKKIILFYGSKNKQFKKFHGNNGLSLEQSKTQMNFWSIWSAPLMMSADLRRITPEFKKILQNKELISINQDRDGRMASLIYKIRFNVSKLIPREEIQDEYLVFDLHDADTVMKIISSEENLELRVPSSGGSRIVKLVPVLKNENLFETNEDTLDNFCDY